MWSCFRSNYESSPSFSVLLEGKGECSFGHGFILLEGRWWKVKVLSWMG